MDGHEMAEVVGAVGIFTILVVVVYHLAATWRAKVLLRREDGYRSLAETAIRAQEGTDLRLRDLALHLAEMQTRMKSVERILKEVE